MLIVNTLKSFAGILRRRPLCSINDWEKKERGYEHETEKPNLQAALCTSGQPYGERWRDFRPALSSNGKPYVGDPSLGRVMSPVFLRELAREGCLLRAPDKP